MESTIVTNSIIILVIPTLILIYFAKMAYLRYKDTKR